MELSSCLLFIRSEDLYQRTEPFFRKYLVSTCIQRRNRKTKLCYSDFKVVFAQRLSRNFDPKIFRTLSQQTKPAFRKRKTREEVSRTRNDFFLDQDANRESH